MITEIEAEEIFGFCAASFTEEKVYVGPLCPLLLRLAERYPKLREIYDDWPWDLIVDSFKLDLRREEKMQIKDELLSPYDASKIADVSSQTVRSWADQGKLSVIRTAGGMRLFKRSEVEALVVERKKDKKKDHA